MTVPHWIFTKLTRPARTIKTPQERPSYAPDLASQPKKTPHGPTPMGDRELGISSKN